LLGLLQLKVGDKVELGDKQFIVEKLIILEPDRGTNFVSFAPRVMINLDDLPATKLIQLTSRVNYKTLFAAEPFTRVDTFVSAQKVGPGQRFEDARQGRPELRATLDRAERFLALVALLSALIAATAIALAARRFAQRH
jgi:putative ABC transport system permease protein